jgi:hypothetical protein
MLKINKIDIENFRGIKSKITLDFKKGGSYTSVIIYGRNGTGKSSIIDAWEWLLNTKIEYLSKEGVSQQDYAHKLSDGNNVYINVDLSHSEIKFVKSVHNKNKISSPIRSGEHESFKQHSQYPNYLRYADLQDFVFKTKGDKYKYIARFFGLDNFIKNQSDVQASLGRLSGQLSVIKRSLSENEELLQKYTGTTQANEASIVTCLNKITEKHGLSEIKEFKDVSTVRSAVGKLVESNPAALQLAEYTSFENRLNQLFPIPDILQDCADIESNFNQLKADEANIGKLVLLKLYENATQALTNLKDKSRCPLCDTNFIGDLTKHISEKHDILSGLSRIRQAFIDKRQSLLGKLENIASKSTNLAAEKNENILILLPEELKEIATLHTALPSKISLLKQKLEDTNNLSFSNSIEIVLIEKIRSQEIDIKTKLAEKIKELSQNEASKKLASDFESLIQITDAYTSALKNKKKIEYLENIIESSTILYNHLTAFIQSQIQSTFNIIQNDVSECYNFLESSNEYLKNPSIKLVEGRDKSIELEIEFVSERITPAYKFMSESQINSFGLSIFLAAVKHFNKDFKFFILDDVVNSFDAFKRPKVAQLIAQKFLDFQALILTHDQIYFETVQKSFPNWNRYKFTGWDYTTGPRIQHSRNYIEEITKNLEDDDAIAAGQKLGRYLEMVFGTLNQNLQTPIKYKLENLYTLSEFHEPLVKRFKDKLKSQNKQHIVVNLFLNFDQGTIFRNYCAHYKNESTEFTSIEIKALLDKWLEIEAELWCNSCKSYCAYESISNKEYIRCTCGNVDLNVPEKFV